jgi:predicted HD phosphohydrolase
MSFARCLHDIGDTLGSWNHPDVGAAILKPFVSEANHWMVEKHGIFQGYFFFEHIGLNAEHARSVSRPSAFRAHRALLRNLRQPRFQSRAGMRAAGILRADGAPVFAAPKNSIYKDACVARIGRGEGKSS